MGDFLELSWSRRRKIWQFPSDPFVTYEPSDEAWCRPLGIGKEVEITEVMLAPNAYMSAISIDGSMTFRGLAPPTITQVEPSNE